MLDPPFSGSSVARHSHRDWRPAVRTGMKWQLDTLLSEKYTTKQLQFSVFTHFMNGETLKRKRKTATGNENSANGRPTRWPALPWLLEMVCGYLDVFVDAPGRRFPVVYRLDSGLSDSGQVTSAKQPRNAGLHRHRIHTWKVIVVQLQRIQCFDHCTHTWC